MNRRDFFGRVAAVVPFLKHLAPAPIAAPVSAPLTIAKTVGNAAPYITGMSFMNTSDAEVFLQNDFFHIVIPPKSTYEWDGPVPQSYVVNLKAPGVKLHVWGLS